MESSIILKLPFRISDKLKLFPYGHLTYAVEAGKVFGTVPYPYIVCASRK